MRIIIGLGNPGTEYEKTRHNIGFMVIDKLAKDLKVELSEKKFDGVFYKDNDLILAKPLTYMNNSGNFVQNLIKYFYNLISIIEKQHIQHSQQEQKD